MDDNHRRKWDAETYAKLAKQREEEEEEEEVRRDKKGLTVKRETLKPRSYKVGSKGVLQ